MDDKAVLGIFRNLHINADFDANPLNKRSLVMTQVKYHRCSRKTNGDPRKTKQGEIISAVVARTT